MGKVKGISGKTATLRPEPHGAATGALGERLRRVGPILWLLNRGRRYLHLGLDGSLPVLHGLLLKALDCGIRSWMGRGCPAGGNLKGLFLLPRLLLQQNYLLKNY